ncbi:MAG: prepilin-type N-terminal cleavage/methylation domain-containing protein, partial [Verrucomicrobiota bacterium]
MPFRPNSRRHSFASVRAFTLIEVMLAVAITGLVAFGIFRFVEANLLAVRFSAEQSERDASMRALMKILQDQLNDLPRGQAGALLGEAHLFNNLAADEIQWVSGAGLGLLTIHAAGDYKVTLTLKETKVPARFDLGVRRMIADGSSKDENWVTLMKNVKAMEIRYFD